MLQVKSGYTKGKPRHFEMWWWNRDMDMDVGRKKELFKIWKQSQNEEDIKKYCKAKKDAKRPVSMAMDQEAWEAAETVHLCCDGCELFRIVKQRAGEKKVVLRVSCLKDEIRTVKVFMIERKSRRSMWKSL